MPLIPPLQFSAGACAPDSRPIPTGSGRARSVLLSCLFAVLASFIGAQPTIGAAASATLPGPNNSDAPPIEPEAPAPGKRKWETYESLMQSHGTLTAYGPDLFGDSVNLANGALSFAVTDVSIPGNSALPVQFRRLYSVRNREFQISDGALADWTVDLSHVCRMATPDGPSTVSVWKDGHCQSASGDGEGPAAVEAGGEVVLTAQGLEFGVRDVVV